MTPDTNKSTNVADKMKTVKAAWDKAPSGPKKDAALKHYQAAERPIRPRMTPARTSPWTPRPTLWRDVTACLPGNARRAGGLGKPVQEFPLKRSHPFHEELILNLRVAGFFSRATLIPFRDAQRHSDRGLTSCSGCDDAKAFFSSC